MIYHSKRHLYQLENIQKSLTIDHKKELAAAFSDGKFSAVYDYLAEDVNWIVVAERETNGKTAVIAECEKISNYFASVTTDFQTHFVIAEGDTVVVSGTGAFLRNGKRFSLISACEVYEFNQAGQIYKIKSYCIEDNK